MTLSRKMIEASGKKIESKSIISVLLSREIKNIGHIFFLFSINSKLMLQIHYMQFVQFCLVIFIFNSLQNGYYRFFNYIFER